MCKDAFDIWQNENAAKLKQASNLTYSAVLRTGEMSVATPKEATKLLVHHTQQVAADLKSWKTPIPSYMDQNGYEKRERLQKLRDFPLYMRNRLDPVFARPDLFDPRGRYKKRFAHWEEEYLDRLDLIDYWNKGKGSVARRYKDHIMSFHEFIGTTDCIVKDMLDDMDIEVSL